MLATATAADRLNAGRLADRHAGTALGGKAAFVATDGVLTYDELRERANQAGNLLRELGVRREERLLLVLDDTTIFPVMFLGAMRIGAVPVAISVLDKAENFRHYAEDTYAETVICDAAVLPRLREALAGHRARYLVRGDEAGEVLDLDVGLAAQSTELDVLDTHRDDMAFWLYSSGSTGKPKGVVHLHHDIETTCVNYAERLLGLRQEDVTFSTTKLFHAYGLGNGLSFPLWTGATSVLMSGPTKTGPILETLRTRRPTVFFCVPALYAALLREPEEATVEALSSVRVCVSAAEALPAHVTEAWRSRHDLEILDGIGSTEMLHIFCSNRPGEIVPGTTGRPVPGYELRIIDESGEEIEGAGTGALEVRGDSAAAFYWHQHGKTKNCMRGDWLSTGDLYERDADGLYTYVGRSDDMFKIGGLWVSPTDMEAVLGEHERVLGVGVVGTHVDGASRIAAYVIADADDSEELAEELRAWCKERMRRYEYPHLVIFVDDLPRTLNGKVQRFKLRERAAAEAATSA